MVSLAVSAWDCQIPTNASCCLAACPQSARSRATTRTAKRPFICPVQVRGVKVSGPARDLRWSTIGRGDCLYPRPRLPPCQCRPLVARWQPERTPQGDPPPPIRLAVSVVFLRPQICRTAPNTPRRLGGRRRSFRGQGNAFPRPHLGPRSASTCVPFAACLQGIRPPRPGSSLQHPRRRFEEHPTSTTDGARLPGAWRCTVSSGT
jgi:hypothetical protein